MIICRSKGFIFIRVPKTASSSISKQLCNNIKFDHNIDAYSQYAGFPSLNINERCSVNEHATLSQFLESKIITQNDLKSLNVFGVLRNPVDRAISLFSHVLKDFAQKNIENFSKNDIIESGLELFYSSKHRYFYSDPLIVGDGWLQVFALLPQSFWLVHNNKPISNIIIYPNFSNFLEKFTGLKELQFNMKVGKTYTKYDKASPSYVSELRKIYFDDFRLWETQTNTPAVSY